MRWKSTEIGAHLSCKFNVKACTHYISPHFQWVSLYFLGVIFWSFCIKIANKLISWAHFLHGNKYLDNWSSETSGRGPPSHSPTAFCSFMPVPMKSPWEQLWGCAETETQGFSALVCVSRSVWLLCGVDPGNGEFWAPSSFCLVTRWFSKTRLPLGLTRKGKKAVHREQQSSRQLSLLSSLEIMVENTTGSFREADPPHSFRWMDSV